MSSHSTPKVSFGTAPARRSFSSSRSDFLFPVANDKPKGCAQSSKAVSSHSTPKGAARTPTNGGKGQEVNRVHQGSGTSIFPVSHQRKEVRPTGNTVASIIRHPLPSKPSPTVYTNVGWVEPARPTTPSHWHPNSVVPSHHVHRRWASMTRPTLRHLLRGIARASRTEPDAEELLPVRATRSSMFLKGAAPVGCE